MIVAVCDAGCKEDFEVKGTQTAKLDAGVEKTYFNCPICQHEYVAYYTDEEIRKLQEKIRKAQGRNTNPYNNAKWKKIKAKMEELRKRTEGSA